MHSRFEGRVSAYLACAVFVLAASTCYVAQSRHISVFEVTARDSYVGLKSAINYGETRRQLAEVKGEALRGYLLPEDVRRAVGDERVGVFTVELAYVAANSLSYAPLPVFHTYQANTPYLENLDAAYLENPRTAPAFMFVDENLGILDERSAIADVPATWLSFYRWYDVIYKSDVWALFKRRPTPRFGEPVLIERRDFKRGERIEVPGSPHPVLAKVYIELSDFGSLANVFFRVPEVAIVAHARSGELFKGRVVETIENGLFINYMPVSFDAVLALFQRGESATVMDSFELTGKGPGYYREKGRVEFYELPGVTIKPASGG